MIAIMNTIIRALAICGLILLVNVSVSSAQARVSSQENIVPDTAINPHDFTDEFYATQGINGRSILGRRNGYDYLSIFGFSTNPNHRPVRVLATLPAWGPRGEIYFWYPLGQISYKGFTPNRVGSAALKNAMASPIYVFPMRSDLPMGASSYSLFDVRQSAFIDPGMRPADPSMRDNAGPRVIAFVNYTPYAFTKDCEEMMNYMKLKNGTAADDTPAIRGMGDIQFLKKEGMITVETADIFDTETVPVAFALAPIIVDPTNGAIAPDAFLIMPRLNGEPLPYESIFVEQFNCLQKHGTWCLQ
jgi:hypothetical protein